MPITWLPMSVGMTGCIDPFLLLYATARKVDYVGWFFLGAGRRKLRV